MVCVYDGTVSAGELILESAREDDYSGTWANKGNSVGASNATDEVTSRDPANFWRIRVGTPLTGGGTVKAYLKAKGQY